MLPTLRNQIMKIKSILLAILCATTVPSVHADTRLDTDFFKAGIKKEYKNDKAGLEKQSDVLGQVNMCAVLGWLAYKENGGNAGYTVRKTGISHSNFKMFALQSSVINVIMRDIVIGGEGIRKLSTDQYYDIAKKANKILVTDLKGMSTSSEYYAIAFQKMDCYKKLYDIGLDI